MSGDCDVTRNAIRATDLPTEGRAETNAEERVDTAQETYEWVAPDRITRESRLSMSLPAESFQFSTPGRVDQTQGTQAENPQDMSEEVINSSLSELMQAHHINSPVAETRNADSVMEWEEIPSAGIPSTETEEVPDTRLIGWIGRLNLDDPKAGIPEVYVVRNNMHPTPPTSHHSARFLSLVPDDHLALAVAEPVNGLGCSHSSRSSAALCYGESIRSAKEPWTSS